MTNPFSSPLTMSGHSFQSFICCYPDWCMNIYSCISTLLFALPSFHNCIVDGRFNTIFQIPLLKFIDSLILQLMGITILLNLEFHWFTDIYHPIIENIFAIWISWTIYISNGTDSITVVLALPIHFSFHFVSIYPLFSSFFCKCFSLLCIYPSCCSTSSFYS